MLAESPGLYEKLSAHEFLEFMGALYDVPGSILSERIDDLLKLFGLYERRDYLLEGYSRGMKQKVLIASALIHDPPILFSPPQHNCQLWLFYRGILLDTEFFNKQSYLGYPWIPYVSFVP